MPQEYLLRTAGGGFESAQLAWSEALLAELAALRRPDRDPAILSRLGEFLRSFLAPLGFAQHEQQILHACSRGERVVLTLRSAAAELYALPWELVTLKATGQHLGELPSLILRYEWPETTTVPENPSPRPSGSRIVFAWSAAGGAVPAAEQLEAIHEACAAGTYPFDVARDVVANASFQRISEALAQAQRDSTPIAVLHLLCHGATAGSTFGLALNDDSGNGGAAVVDAGRLRALLAPYAGMVRLVVLQACDSSNSGALGNQLGSVAQALHRAGIATVLASRYPLSIAGSIRLTQALYRRMLVDLDSLESAVLFARRDLAKDPSRLDWAGVQIYGRASDGDDARPVVFRPYRGLSAFQPGDRRFYFGRERDIDRIVKLLSSGSRLVTLVGASGAGKSSLILAGVVPVLARQLGDRSLRVRVVRPGATPCLALALALCSIDGQAKSAVSPSERPVAELRRGLLKRRQTLAELAAATPDTRLLIVVDQAEELFSQSDRAEATAFIEGLLHAIAIADGPVAVVLTLRADFLGVCLDQPTLAEPVRESMELILPLGRDDLQQAILRPAALVGLGFEEGLVDALLDAICDAGAVSSEPQAERDLAPERRLGTLGVGSLPLLQFTLEQLWERRSGNTITWHTWRAIGGVRGAITRRADDILAASRKSDETSLVQKLFGRLVQLGEGTLDTRRRAQRSELESIAPGHMARVVARWVDARLLTADESEVTIAHEALLYEWETLRRWIDDSRESLRVLQRLSRDSRHYFGNGEIADDLWHGSPLRRALALQHEGKLQLSDEEATFLQRSAQAAAAHQALLEQQAKRARDLDAGLGGKARTVAILALVAAGGALHFIARMRLREIGHELYMLMTVLVAALGAVMLLMLKHSSINNEFNRRTLSLCMTATGPIFVNHWIGLVFGFPSDQSSVIDLNIILMLCIVGAITLDARLSALVGLNVIGILIATQKPQWIGPIMAIFPTLDILFMSWLYGRHAGRESQPAEPPAT
ncbi:MAG: CHAT domain-containing protein [Myxococcales bacterium]|nr:CHAT domain-containing protein [Myxococcales bacterium]